MIQSRRVSTLSIFALVGAVVGSISSPAAGAFSDGPTGKKTLAESRAASAPPSPVETATVIDVRSAAEYETSHLKGASSIDVESPDFEKKVASLDKSKPYALYCRSGRRSGVALEKMKSMGFTLVENLGSQEDAAKKLKLDCEGQKPSC